MSIEEFAEKVKEEYSLKTAVPDIVKYVIDKARKEAKGKQSIAIDDETVKDWIINVDFADIKAESKPAKKEAEKTEIIKPVEEPKPAKVKKAKEKTNDTKYEELSLFDIYS